MTRISINRFVCVLLCGIVLACSKSKSRVSVVLQSPNGGEVLATTHNIRWTSRTAGVTTQVDIHLSADGGVTYPTLVASRVPNTGQYAWNLSAVANGNTHRIRVTLIDRSSIVSDVSNANFTITNPPPPPLASLAGPRLLGFSFRRTYSPSNPGGAFGPGWDHTGHHFLVLPMDGGSPGDTITHSEGLGEPHTCRFSHTAGATRHYVSDRAGCGNIVLGREASGGFVARQGSTGEPTYVFRPAVPATSDPLILRLQSIRDPSGDRIRFRYDSGTGRLQSVLGLNGEPYLQLHYERTKDGAERVHRMRDYSGREWVYGYVDGRLAAVTSGTASFSYAHDDTGYLEVGSRGPRATGGHGTPSHELLRVLVRGGGRGAAFVAGLDDVIVARAWRFDARNTPWVILVSYGHPQLNAPSLVRSPRELVNAKEVPLQSGQ